MSDDKKPIVLVVDDDALVARAMARSLDGQGFDIEIFHDPLEVLARVRAKRDVDLIISDINMPRLSGLKMVASLRQADDQLPVVFVTGAPQLSDAMKAMELGAFRYLTKPVDPVIARRVASDAVQWGRLARMAIGSPVVAERTALEAAFTRAAASLTMAYQPIVHPRTRALFGYEALMRSKEPALPSPPAVIEAAEKLGRVHALGRQLREIVAEQMQRAQPFEHAFFVNLHASDLVDPLLYDTSSPLAAFARFVVLEITERASIEGLSEVENRIQRLRAMGFRIAIDDLGAGYAGLSYFARIGPDVVKIDMSLTRGIDADPLRQRVVGTLCSLSRSLHMTVVAEGIETPAELAVVTDLGVDLVQGYLTGRPGPYPSAPRDGASAPV